MFRIKSGVCENSGSCTGIQKIFMRMLSMGGKDLKCMNRVLFSRVKSTQDKTRVFFQGNGLKLTQVKKI